VKVRSWAAVGSWRAARTLSRMALTFACCILRFHFDLEFVLGIDEYGVLKARIKYK